MCRSLLELCDVQLHDSLTAAKNTVQTIIAEVSIEEKVTQKFLHKFDCRIISLLAKYKVESESILS